MQIRLLAGLPCSGKTRTLQSWARTDGIQYDCVDPKYILEQHKDNCKTKSVINITDDHFCNPFILRNFIEKINKIGSSNYISCYYLVPNIDACYATAIWKQRNKCPFDQNKFDELMERYKHFFIPLDSSAGMLPVLPSNYAEYIKNKNK